MSNRVEREVDLPCTPQRLWHELTDGEALSGWLADEVKLELFAGGEASFREAGELREGWVEEVQPPQGHRAPGAPDGRLSFWWSRGDGPSSRVELTLIALADGHTRLRVAETQPLELLDVVGIPLPGAGGRTFGPALVAA